jgi:hypothetical protein
LEAPNNTSKLLHTKIEPGAASSDKGSKEPKSNKNSMKWMGNSNPFGGSVDLGLLLRIRKGFQVLVAREGDLVNLSLTLMVAREWKP